MTVAPPLLLNIGTRLPLEEVKPAFAILAVHAIFPRLIYFHTIALSAPKTFQIAVHALIAAIVETGAVVAKNPTAKKSMSIFHRKRSGQISGRSSAIQPARPKVTLINCHFGHAICVSRLKCNRDRPATSQRSFASAEFALKKKRTRREKSLAEMERVVPCSRFMGVIEPLYTTSGRVGRQPIGVAKMRRIYSLQQWYGVADEALEEPPQKKPKPHPGQYQRNMRPALKPQLNFDRLQS